MGLFDKIKGPVFYKQDSEAERQLEALLNLKETASEKIADIIDQAIRYVEAGIAGEKQVRFELENSHIPMYVIHDLYLEHEGLTSQIDYLLITRKRNFVIECKNLYGNIEINNSGDFIRTFGHGRNAKKEGIYSPITQNRRHLELIKKIRAEEKNALMQVLFEKNFFQIYRSVVVLANPKTVLNAKYAKKEVRNQVIRADQLAEYIRRINSEPEAAALSEKYMEELAQYFVSKHQQNPIDYTEKIRKLIEDSESKVSENTVQGEIANAQANSKQAPAPLEVIICPKCGASMVRRKASKGPKAGKEFFGCSMFPSCRGIVNVQ